MTIGFNLGSKVKSIGESKYSVSTRCAFKSEPCNRRPSIGSSLATMMCAWHYECLSKPELIGNVQAEDEFWDKRDKETAEQKSIDDPDKCMVKGLKVLVMLGMRDRANRVYKMQPQRIKDMCKEFKNWKPEGGLF